LSQLQQYSRELPCPVYVKRDDLVGNVLAGGPMRKLEFLLQEAKAKKATAVVTCGDVQSEWVRSATLAARQINLDVYLYVNGTKPKTPKDNIFLGHLVGAAIYYLSPEEYKDVDRLMGILERRLIAKGERPYLIPEGGAGPAGFWGYISMVKELYDNYKKIKFTHIIVPVETGVTLASLLLARRLFKLQNLEIIGVCIYNNSAYYEEKIKSFFQIFNKKYGTNYEVDHYQLWEQYQGKEKQEEIIKMVKRVARIEGVLLDPTATGRAFFAMIDQLINNSMAIGKAQVLFVHTGGLSTLLNQRKLFVNISADQDAKSEIFPKPGEKEDSTSTLIPLDVE